MLSKKQLDDVCLPYGGHSRCRYLAQDDDDYTKFFCLKKTSQKGDMDVELVELVQELKKKGVSPESQGVPLGDNCSGYLLLRHKEQGYDKD